jgi:hypothetical protein
MKPRKNKIAGDELRWMIRAYILGGTGCSGKEVKTNGY